MYRAVESLGGGLLGFVVGSFLCAPVIAHVFGPTIVTWDASACPPGVYTITSTARSTADSRSFTATTQHIRLPKPSIVQDFGSLPIGQYQVSAVVRDARGRTFGSSTQTVSGQGGTRGRQVTPSYAGSAPSSFGAKASTAPATVKSVFPLPSPAPAVSADPPSSVPPSVRLSAAILDQLVGLGRSTIDDGRWTMFSWWKSVAFLDTDGDGVMDTVRIEFVTGEVWFASLG